MIHPQCRSAHRLCMWVRLEAPPMDPPTRRSITVPAAVVFLYSFVGCLRPSHSPNAENLDAVPGPPLRPRLHVQRQHTNYVRVACISDDGQMIIKLSVGLRGE